MCRRWGRDLVLFCISLAAVVEVDKLRWFPKIEFEPEDLLK